MTDFKWRHFQGDVILWAVRWYCRYPISYRDLEEMLAERGISVDHTTIYRWVQCYAPEMEKRLRWFWRRGFDPSWRLDETYGVPGVQGGHGCLNEPRVCLEY
ncbi:Transposase [Klebsiella pneumoniae]|nr:transposase [Klebsiella pneumoniae]SXB39979.1 transposase [Klebsiella pneumoniae]SXB44276.1 transposase [Klebsiella pneumoniae]SXB52185.1 transposase [Klebsiella pneumoniae]SXB67573.1 transposase [Klebsiella pneumoniae]